VSAEAAVLIEDDPLLDADFIKEIVKQIRAVDTYGSYEGWSVAKIVDPFVLTKERKREIPIVGDPDETTMMRVKAYYNAIATLIEVRGGLMAVPVINLSHEGFGRAFITCGRLIVLEKTLRDVHRFGFPSLEKLNEEGETAITKAIEMIEKFREVAEY
jgi:probable nitrogen fixation protein